MKRSIMLLSVLATLATSAAAGPFDTGDSYGPHAPAGTTVSTGAADATAFAPITHSADVVLSPDTTQADVDAQVRANIAAGRASYDAIAKAGGCNADHQPVAVAAYCWAKTDGATEVNPTGGPVGASMGGSDSSDSGSE